MVMPDESGFDVLKRMFEGVSRDQCIWFCLICWSIWNRRNRWVWDKANGSAFGVKAAALHLLHDWRKAQESQAKNQVAMNNIADKRWNKPPYDWLKINIDATGVQDGYIGFGCVIRNSQGLFIAARCGRIRGNWSPREAEALRLREAIIWLKHLHLDCCIFETDCQSLVSACYGKEGCAYFNTIVEDCKLVLKHFHHVLVKFVYRSANCVAHELARTALSMSDLGEWHVTPPVFLNHVLGSDVSV